MDAATNGAPPSVGADGRRSSAPVRHRPSVHLVGIDGSGCAGITSEAMGVVGRAQVIVGGERLLTWVTSGSFQGPGLEGSIAPGPSSGEPL